jgi:hypothetical protein
MLFIGKRGLHLATTCIGAATLCLFATVVEAQSLSATAPAPVDAIYSPLGVPAPPGPPDNGANNPAPSGGLFPSVCRVNLVGGGIGSGTLITIGTRVYVLTAAHVVTNGSPATGKPIAQSVTFVTNTGTTTIGVVGWNVAPNYVPIGATAPRNDIGILQLAVVPSTLDALIVPSAIYTGNAENGAAATLVGYGLTNATTATANGLTFAGVKRSGANTVTGFSGQGVAPETTSLLNFTYTAGTNSAIMQGDSGGPAFIGGQVAGVASFVQYSNASPGGFVFPSNGDQFFETRVSQYQSYINSVLPEPSAYAQFVLGSLAGLSLLARRRMRRGTQRAQMAA